MSAPVPRRRSRLRALSAGLAVALPIAAVACTGGGEQAVPAESAQAAPDCPIAAVPVVVSVDQWGDIVSELGGQCAAVTTVLASSAVDPHDFEPAPRDAATFDGARLVVVNGGHYDGWASKLAAQSAPEAPVINALEASGAEEHAHGHEDHAHGHEDHAHGHEEGHAQAGESNPHVWYNPAAVTAVADAVTAELSKLAPDATGYFDEQRANFTETMKPYHAKIDAIRADAQGKTYAATESVFDDMAAAVGLQNRTPAGYQTAAANETDPSPADLDALLRLLSDRAVDVLVYNTQTEGSVPQQVRTAAEQAGVPIVEVTETVPPGTTSFAAWQVAQLDALAKALGVAT